MNHVHYKYFNDRFFSNFWHRIQSRRKMVTFYSTLVGFLYILFNIDLVFSQDYDALVVIDNLPTRSGPTAKLPHKAEEINSQIFYPETTEDGRKIEYSHLCPFETPEMLLGVIQQSNEYPEYFYSLEKNIFTTPPSKCRREVKPLMIKHRDLRDLKCSKSSGYLPYNFAFNYIKLKHRSSPEIKEIVTLRLYDVCFYNKARVMWTRHRVTTGLMLQGEGLPSQQIQPPFNYSKEYYSSSSKDLFERMDKAYKNQKYNIHTMVPQMMVPHEDFALKLWKQATIHYANTSPLWENLVPLMKAINDGIRKAGIMVSVKTYKPLEQLSDHLDIYTRSVDYSYRDELKALVKKSYALRLQEFGLNVWCKFIYYESAKKGLMVYLHNLPKFPPIQIISTSSNSNPEVSYEYTACTTPVPCDFPEWADKPGLSDDLLNYAYCCPVNNKNVKELFGIELDTELSLLDINNFIINQKKKSIILFGQTVQTEEDDLKLI